MKGQFALDNGMTMASGSSVLTSSVSCFVSKLRTNKQVYFQVYSS